MAPPTDADILGAPRLCPNCEQRLQRRPTEGELSFAKRIYCAARCYRAALRNNRHKIYQYKTEGRYVGP